MLHDMVTEAADVRRLPAGRPVGRLDAVGPPGAPWPQNGRSVSPSSTATGRPPTAMPNSSATSPLFAAWLEDAGGSALGDVVSIQLPNWYEFVVVAVATQRVGGVINPLLPVYRRRELLHAVTVAESKVVCTPAIYRNHDHLAETRAVIADSGRPVVHVVVDETRPVTERGASRVRTVWFADTMA